MNKLLLSTVAILSTFAIHANPFSIIKNGQEIPVRSEHLDSILRSIQSEQDFESYLHQGNGIRITKDDEGNYRLCSQIGLKGGGVAGANVGFWIGKGLVYAVGYGVVNTVAAFSGPAAPGVVPAANLMAAPVIEGWSNAVGISFGLIGGIFTGPV